MSWRNPDEKPPAALIKGLIAAHTRGATIVGLCLGAFVLAEAGLLDGRRATTHWAYAEEFSTRYPQVSVDSDVLYVEDNRILTSAGTAAGLDCCLFLMRKHFGSAVANRVARRLVVPPHRQGGQAQFIERPIPETPSNSRLSQSLACLKKNLHLTHTVDSIALTASMSRRTFTRQFKQLTGMGFASWLAMERLSYVQRLLESTVLSIDTVAERSGFGSAESLRLHFRRQYGVSPREWRRTFRSD